MQGLGSTSAHPREARRARAQGRGLRLYAFAAETLNMRMQTTGCRQPTNEEGGSRQKVRSTRQQDAALPVPCARGSHRRLEAPPSPQHSLCCMGHDRRHNLHGSGLHRYGRGRRLGLLLPTLKRAEEEADGDHHE